jgi:riboflavin synthase
MFTGLVQQLGRIAQKRGGSLDVHVGDDPEGWALGDSVAVNGCCLTVTGVSPGLLCFDLSPETLRRTAFGHLVVGSILNIERPLHPTGRFDGHIVQGHVDATGVFLRSVPDGGCHTFTFQAPPEFDRYLIDKGSVAVDGISLTVINPKQGAFDVAIIPHTLNHTNLGALRPGDPINLEFDIIARYVERLMQTQGKLGPC